MSRYLIEQIKYGENNGGVACGPVGGVICVSIKYKKDEEPSRYLELDDVDGIPNFYLSDEELFDFHVNFNSYDDEGEAKRFVKDFIDNLDGFDIPDNYFELFEEFYGKQGTNPVTLLLKYIILVARCSDYDVESIIESAIGKYVDEIIIPKGDIEQDYLDGLE